MRWNVCGSGRLGVLLVAAVLCGCRADREQDAPAQTIVVRDAPRSADAREYDSGERAPNRIEVVVADPRGGGVGGSGPSPLSALVGRNVRVQFRRDALGSAAPAPVPPTGQGPGGRSVSVTGVVRSATGGWLVLEHDKGSYYVSLASVLMIEQSDSSTTLPDTE